MIKAIFFKNISNKKYKNIRPKHKYKLSFLGKHLLKENVNRKMLFKDSFLDDLFIIIYKDKLQTLIEKILLIFIFTDI